MIEPREFYKLLKKNGFEFFAGVPDSLLKNICAYITDHIAPDRHIITANEGNAVAAAAGYYLATGKPALVYMQNSGLGNTVNPLTSLASADVYGIPILLMIGWRAGPRVVDEPQHKQMGRIQNKLLETLEVPYANIGSTVSTAEKSLKKASDHFKKNSSPFAIIVEKGVFADYILKSTKKFSFPLNREQAVETILPLIGKKDIIVSTTGKTSRELFEVRERLRESHEKDFLCVGNMGHTSSLALGIAIAKPQRKIWCFDGDGSMIMHMGATAVIGQSQPKNLIHVIFNNFAHDSVGGQPTAADAVDFPQIAQACNYRHVFSIKTQREIKTIISKAKKMHGPIFIEIKCNKGSRSDLGRPTKTPKDNKEDFMKFVFQKTNGKRNK